MERLAGRVILLWNWPRRLVAAAVGAFAALGLAPFDFVAVGLIAFPILVWLLDGTPLAGGFVRRFLPAFSVGWWFGFGYFLAGLWWVGTAFLRDTTLLWAMPFAMFALPAILAFFYGFATVLARLLWSDGIGRVAALAFAFGAVEWLRSILGISWNSIGLIAMPVPMLMQATHLVGMAGMSAVAVFIFATPALLGTKQHARIGLVLAGLMFAAQLGYGYFRLATPPSSDVTLSARIVQLGDDETSFDESLTTYLALSTRPKEKESPPQLILWPELAVPFVLAEEPDLLTEIVGELPENVHLAFGTKRAEGLQGTENRRLYNSIVMVGEKSGILDAADKINILPIMDYQPLDALLHVFRSGRASGDADHFSGGSRKVIPISGNIGAAPLIGTDAVFSEIDESLISQAHIILNPADYSVFGSFPAPYQHLRQVQLLAVQAGLPLLLAMPQGPSAAIDSRGRVMDALAANFRGIVDVTVPLSRVQGSPVANNSLRGLVFSSIMGFGALFAVFRTGYPHSCD